MVVGVLALQGDVAEHSKLVEQLGYVVQEVRTVADYDTVDCLIIPGGESTTLRLLLESSGLLVAMRNRLVPMFGTCAGAIILAEIIEGESPILGCIPMSIRRNAYGSQLQSFEAEVDMVDIGTIQAAFIRAPEITHIGAGAEVVGTYTTVPVAVYAQPHLALTFHPEVVGESRIHAWWLAQVSN